MKITIITPSYNSEKSIAGTIQSLLDQTILKGGRPESEAPERPEQQKPEQQKSEQQEPEQQKPELEYLLIDGASRDNTVGIAEGFRAALEEAGVQFRVISEPDGGIYDAMNKGIARASGDIIGILNSDDWYEPRALETVLKTFTETGCDLMFADIRMHKADGSSFVKKARQRKRYQTSRDWNHPTTFVRAALYKQYPFRKLGIHDDYGFYLQMRKLPVKIVTVEQVLANFRMGGASNRKSLKRAIRRIKERYLYCYRINGYSRWYLIECVLIEAAKMVLG